MEVLNIIGNLFLIAFICVNLIDISGFIQEMENSLSKWLHIKAKIPKPFSCSYCMSHWFSLAYLIIIGKLNLPFYAIVLAFSFLTPEIETMERLIKDFLSTLLNFLYKKIE